MHYYIIIFDSSKFDMGAEPENPINPIHGISLLNWIVEKIKPEGIDITEPDAEDWGWYSYAILKRQKYLVGARIRVRVEWR